MSFEIFLIPSIIRQVIMGGSDFASAFSSAFASLHLAVIIPLQRTGRPLMQAVLTGCGLMQSHAGKDPRYCGRHILIDCALQRGVESKGLFHNF